MLLPVTKRILLLLTFSLLPGVPLLKRIKRVKKIDPLLCFSTHIHVSYERTDTEYNVMQFKLQSCSLNLTFVEFDPVLIELYGHCHGFSYYVPVLEYI